MQIDFILNSVDFIQNVEISKDKTDVKMCYISTFAHDDEGHVHIALEFKMNCNLLSGMHLGLFFCV